MAQEKAEREKIRLENRAQRKKERAIERKRIREIKKVELAIEKAEAEKPPHDEVKTEEIKPAWVLEDPYQVGGVVTIDSKVFAHFFSTPKIIAYGKYFSNISGVKFCRSASKNTDISPLELLNPVLIAAPFPRFLK